MLFRSGCHVGSSTQFLTWKSQHDSPRELPLVGKAGTVVIIHYDLWHRAMANVGAADRFMVKFLFTRMSEPRTTAWRHEDPAWASTGSADDAVCAHLWDWMRGETEAARSPEPGVRELSDGLTAGMEMDRYDAAYQLGATGSEGVEALMERRAEERASTWGPVRSDDFTYISHETAKAIEEAFIPKQ